MLEMGFLVISYIETVGVKWPGRKKIFCIFSDTLVDSGPAIIYEAVGVTWIFGVDRWASKVL